MWGLFSIFFFFFGIGAVLGLLYALACGLPLIFRCFKILSLAFRQGWQSGVAQSQLTHLSSAPKRKTR